MMSGGTNNRHPERILEALNAILAKLTEMKLVLDQIEDNTAA